MYWWRNVSGLLALHAVVSECLSLPHDGHARWTSRWHSIEGRDYWGDVMFFCVYLPCLCVLVFYLCSSEQETVEVRRFGVLRSVLRGLFWPFGIVVCVITYFFFYLFIFFKSPPNPIFKAVFFSICTSWRHVGNFASARDQSLIFLLLNLPLKPVSKSFFIIFFFTRLHWVMVKLFSRAPDLNVHFAVSIENVCFVLKLHISKIVLIILHFCACVISWIVSWHM